MPNQAPTEQENDRRSWFEKRRQRARRQVIARISQLEKAAKKMHAKEVAPEPPSALTGLMKTGESIMGFCGTILGSIPWIGWVFRGAFGLAKGVIKFLRVPLETLTRLGLRKDETEVQKEADRLKKEHKITAPRPRPHASGGLGGFIQRLFNEPIEWGPVKLPAQLKVFVLAAGAMAFMLVVSISFALVCSLPLSVC